MSAPPVPTTDNDEPALPPVAPPPDPLRNPLARVHRGYGSRPDVSADLAEIESAASAPGEEPFAVNVSVADQMCGQRALRIDTSHFFFKL